MAAIIAAGPLAGNLAAHRNDGTGGDVQTELDVRANALLAKALESAPVAAVASEEMDAPLPLRPGAPIIVALDPLDGSSNIDTNVSVGTIFSLLHPPPAAVLSRRRSCAQVASKSLPAILFMDRKRPLP